MNLKKKLPLGLRLMRVLIIIEVVLSVVILYYTLSKYSNLASSSGFNLMAYVYEVFMIVFSLVYSAILMLSINRPRKSLYVTSVVLIPVNMLLSLIYIFIDTFEIIYVTTLLYDVLILWYVVRLRVYFKTGVIDKDEPATKKTNKIFMVSFIVLAMLLIIELGISSFMVANNNLRDSGIIKQINANISGKSPQEALEYCKTVDATQKDVCVYSVAFLSNSKVHAKYKILKENSQQLDPSTCQVVEGAVANISCYAALDGCDLLQDLSQHKLCNTAAEKFLSKFKSQ